MLGRQHLNPNVLQANSCLEFAFETFNNFGYRPMASDTAHRFEICKKISLLESENWLQQAEAVSLTILPSGIY